MRDSIRAVLNFQFKHHRHGFYMPHKEHVPNFKFHRIHVGASTPYTQADLYKEADRRFWLQTNYKVGQKLDSKNKSDVPYIKVWNTVYAKVLAEYKAGTLNIPSSYTISDTIRTPSQVDVHQAQADLHQSQADLHKTEAAEAAKAAVTAAANGDTVKAEIHTAESNAANAKADAHQEQADVHKDIVKQLVDIHSISGLAYLAAKSWSSTPGHSRYFGWAIKEDGTVDTKWTDSVDEIKAWFDALGFSGFIWGLYWDYNNKSADGTMIPSEEYSPTITQAQADKALSAALGKAKTITVPLKDTSLAADASKAASGAGGGAIALMVVLGGGIALAAASSKKRG